jgi:hypothetical protein
MQAGPSDAPSRLSRIDADYVDRIGMTGRIAEWQQLATVELASASMTPAAGAAISSPPRVS